MAFKRWIKAAFGIISIAVFLFLISFASAVWYNPFTWFDNVQSQGEIQTQYKFTAKNSTEDKIEIKIGDDKKPGLTPKIKFQRWDGEANFTIEFMDEEKDDAASKKDKDTIEWNKQNVSAKFYNLTDAYEFEIILKEKPKTNIVNFSFNMEGTAAYYQPALTQEFKVGDEEGRVTEVSETQVKDANGNILYERPENVVGSYAIYGQKRDYKLGGKNYGTGKVAHIYRPKIIDAKGDWVWGILNISKENNLMTITIPQKFLDEAAYPVIVDPTLGYTGGGASTLGMNGYTRIGKGVTMPEDGTLINISAYMYEEGADYKNVGIGIYNQAGGSPNAIVAETAPFELSTGATWIWQTRTISGSLTSGTAYHFAANGQNTGGNVIYLAYDAVAGTLYYQANNYSGSMPTPLSESVSGATGNVSIYVTYSTAAGDTEYPQFSSFQDNNGTLTGSGTALFNTTILNTNGTAYLQINGANYTASNTTATLFNVSVSLASGVYNYFWGSWGNGSSANFNITSSRSYTILPHKFSIDFVPPTPANNTQTPNSSININISIMASNLKEIKYNWNGTNYSFYDDSLILLYNFDNRSLLGENGTHVADLSRYSNNGIVYGGAVWNSTGKYGGAFEFTRLDKNITIFNPHSEIQTSDSFTLSVWAYPRSNTSGTWDDFITIGLPNYDSRRLLIYYYAPTNKFGWSSSYTNTSNSTGIGISGDCSTITFPNRWYNIIKIVDNSSKMVNFYVNNVLCSSKNYSAADGVVKDVIGHFRINIDFNGSIDDIAYWNRSLSSSEITQLYNSQLTKYDSHNWSLSINQTDINISTYTYYACIQNSSLGENCTDKRTITRIAGEDTTFPTFSNFQISPANNTDYSPLALYNFNTTIINSNGTAGIQFGGINYTMKNSTSYSLFNKTISDLGAGSYVYYFWAYGNGTAGNYNTTQLFEYRVAKKSLVGTILLTNSHTWTEDYGTTITIGYDESNAGDADVDYILWRNNVNIGDGETILLGGGDWNYKINSTGGQNYSSNALLDPNTMTINRIDQTITALLNSGTSNLTLSYPQQVNISWSGSNQSEMITRINDGLIQPHIYSTYGMGAYVINYSVPQSQNYTLYQDWLNFTINKNTTYSLGISGTTPITYGTSTDVSGSNCPSELSCSMNLPNLAYGVEVSPLRFNYSTAGNANYSENSIIKDITINKAGSQTNLTFTPASPQTYGTAITPYCAFFTGAGSLSLTNGTSGVSITLGGGAWNFNCSYAGNNNYTASSNFSVYTINKASQSITALLNSGTSNLTLSYPNNVNISWSGANQTELITKINNALITPNINLGYGAGAYDINYSSKSNQNYSSYQDWLNFTINKNTTSLSLTGTTPITYGTSTDFTGSGCNSQITCSLNISNAVYGAGAVNANYSTAGNGNYTASSAIFGITINKASPTLTLLINGTAGNQTANEGVQTNVSAYINNNEQMIVLLNNSIDATASNHIYNILAAGNYNFTAYVISTQNYSYAAITRWSHIISVVDITPPTITNLANITHVVNTTLTKQWTATDASGISCWTINDTTNWNINCSGYMKNITALNSIVVWWLNMSVNDTAGNIRYAWFYVDIIFDASGPTLIILVPQNETYDSSKVEINLTATDSSGISAYWYSLDGGGNVTFNPNSSFFNLGFEAEHTAIFYVNDTLNNLAVQNVKFFVGKEYWKFALILGLVGIVLILILLGLFIFNSEIWMLKTSLFVLALIITLITINSIRIISSPSQNLGKLTETGFIISIVVLSVIFLYLFIMTFKDILFSFKQSKRPEDEEER